MINIIHQVWSYISGKDLIVKNLFLNHEEDKCFANNTSPNSIYIKGDLKFKGFKTFSIHCFVDTGASLCIASKHVIPEELWENAAHPISVHIANDSLMSITKVCKNIPIRIAGEIFEIPTIYQQQSGMDMILGNNFLQLYGPFTQYLDRITLWITKEEPSTKMEYSEQVFISKVAKAFGQAKNENFLESLKKNSKIKPPVPVNITKDVIYETPPFQIGGVTEEQFFVNFQKLQIIENLLEKVCSDNPIDPEKSKKWMTASIKLTDPNTVIRVKPMKYSPQDREEFTKQISELLSLKLIRASKSPHMSPAFLVNNEAEQRRGKKRMVVNYKAINAATIGDSHNLPCMQELLTLIRGKNIFSSFDCKSGFWQVLLDKESQLLTAFTCPDGHFQWNVVPFGLKQAPSIFQRHMQNALRGLEKICCVYVDDILVFSNHEEEHYKHVLMVLRTIENFGIILSKKKANLFKEKINFLGLEIDKGTHTPQNHILEHLHKFPNRIEDKRHLQRFLGVLTYAEAYIPKLAEMRKPLQAKLKKDAIWNWEEKDSKYVEKVKGNLGTFPKLYLPNLEDSLIIETDASNDFWGGVLKAKTTEGEKICRYSSGSFKPAEKNYHSNEKEYLAVKRVIEKFSVYLTPVKFLVRTDNKNFTYFLRTKISGDNKQGRLVRWQNWFSNYSFETEHLAGEKNVLADFLTREFQK